MGMKVFIKLMNAVSADHIRPMEFGLLKARDEYSRLRWNSLRELVGDKAGIIEAVFSQDGDRAAAARWYCRGLRIDLACRKVDYDTAYAEAIRARKHEEKMEAMLAEDVIG